MKNRIILSIGISIIMASCISNGGVKNHVKQSGILSTSLGVLSLDDKVLRKEDTIKLFNDDGSLWYKFSFYYDESDGVYDFQNENFQPYGFHPDYFLLALLVVKETNDSYSVIVNQSSGLTKLVPKTDFLKFFSWSDFITSRVFAIKPNLKSNHILSDTVNRNVIELDLDNILLHPVIIQDDWLKVKWKVGDNWDYGWIRWKNKGDLLISLSMTS